MKTDAEWTQIRTSLLKKMSALLESWNGSAVEAIEIIAENQKNMDVLKTIEEKLTEEAASQYTPIERQLLTAIIPRQQKLMTAIRKEETSLMSKMKQINKKNQVRDNYVSVKRDPIFVDKGV